MSLSSYQTNEREADVRRALGRVDDPELDEPVTDLRFVEHIEIDDAGAVTVGFRLPTYWCAANFAFLMADDMKREVSSLDWVTRVDVTLGDHMYGEQINRGVADGRSFQETFGSEATADLDGLRRTFLVKAFQRRQEALLRHLLAAGVTPEAVAAMTVEGLSSVELSGDGERLRQRYLDRRSVCAASGEILAFVKAGGERLNAGDMAAYLMALGRVGINAEFNGALCRGLLAARFGEPVSEPSAEPTLRDFVVQAAGAEARRLEHGG